MQRISLIDAIIRINSNVPRLMGNDGKPLSDIPDCQALLNLILALAIQQKTHKPLCTMGYASECLMICEKRVRKAFKALEKLELIKTSCTVRSHFAELEFHSHDLAFLLKGWVSDFARGSLVGIAETDTPGVSEMDSHSYTTNTYTTPEESKQKQKLHTCVSDREKVLEEERQIADGKESLVRDEIEDSSASVRLAKPDVSERKRQDSQMAKGERQDGKNQIAEETEAAPAASSANSDTNTSISQTDVFTKEDFVRNFMAFFEFDEDDKGAMELSDIWLKYETSYKHYPQVDYGMLSKFLESRGSLKEYELAFLFLICEFKPSHIRNLRFQTDEIMKQGFNAGESLEGISFLASYCNIAQFCKNWTMVKQLTKECMEKIKLLEKELGKPELWQIKAFCELSVTLDQENSSLDHYLEWFQDLRYDREDIQFTWATTLSKMQTQNYLSSTKDERRTRAEIRQERVDRASLLDRIRKDSHAIPELEKLADALENCRITIGKAKNEYEATLNGYGLR